MFAKAIEEVSKFTRPIHIITRNYDEEIVRPGTGTLFFVNELGCAVTCKHVVDLIIQRETINKKYEELRNEKNAIGKKNYNQRLKQLEEKYGIDKKKNVPMIIQVKDLFMDCTFDTSFSFKTIPHPKYDLAIVVFENFKDPAYQSYARFVKDGSTIRRGDFLCRLGYPFPEFTNFQYNKATDDIEWTDAGRKDTPNFPIEGMFTRSYIDDEKKVFALEISTPGLKGQSGGPLFNENGLVCGMQSMTNHLHLGFDMKNQEFPVNGEKIKVTNQPFLHVGQCIHSDVIKAFLQENKIKFYEE
ncbi:MAG TPA: trypsin-like peptidase domain-containing protein [Bacteroidia bacterium]|jgi:hypothetical protein|nr:trypsin-like peptidase domain-containing protein [Bacteroidia bacterium]